MFQIVTVNQITAYIKEIVESDPLLGSIWIRGEVTNFFESNAAHIYFTLSDNQSKLKCVLFRHSQRGLLYKPQRGAQVVAHGNISVYETNGEYQLYVDDVAPDGTGVIQLEFDRIFRMLESEGLFLAERKRALPAYPSAIGVVTSAQGAVWHDIQTVIARRFPLTELFLAPSQVQGASAPAALIGGLEALQADGRSEVIIIGRGGGSPEDLACFNDERLARAIFASSVPVVSAVGHETDVTIADLVADLRAPTPSAAAELVVPHQREVVSAIRSQMDDVREALEHKVAERTLEQQTRLYRLQHLSPAVHLNRLRQDIDTKASRATSAMDASIRLVNDQLGNRTERAALLNPSRVLERGYAVVESRDDGSTSRVSSAAQALNVQSAKIWFYDGAVAARISREQ